MDNQNSQYRLAALVAGLLLPFVNALLARFGLPSVTEAELITAETIVGGYIIQSAANAMHARHVAAAQDAAPTPAAAVADLAKGPTP